MVRRQCVALLIATTTFLTLFCAFNPGVASSQEEAKNQKAPVEKAQPQVIVARGESGPGVDKPRAEVDKMIAAYDLKPHPPTPIPDDPPPHEGAMISIPYIVEPTDLVVVEVLNALEGRPISGERLLRPDGTISLGYYGEVYGKGLTTRQLKVAIIKHLRADLNDVALGLLEIQDGNVEVPTEMPVDRPNVPELPAGVNNPFNLDGDQKEQKKPTSSSSTIRSPRPGGRARFASQSRPGMRGPSPPVRSQVVRFATQVAPVVHSGDPGTSKTVAPAESRTVFVDVSGYNSKNYYVQGDVLISGKIVWTGNETALDALQLAGGLLPTAEPRDIRLVRPGRGGKPAKVYRVDLAAIREKGDVMSNYQIFPNDRLIVGRNDVVQKTVALDRLAAPIHAATTSIHDTANMLRAVQLVDQANSDQIMKDLVDFWVHEALGKGDLKFDEQTLRDALVQRLKPSTSPKK